MPRARVVLAVAGGIAVGGALLGGYLFYEHRQPHDVRGSPTVEFVPNLEPGRRPRAEPVAARLPWPTCPVQRRRYLP